MAFWGTVSVGVLIVAALMLATHGFDQVEDYHQLPLMLIPVFGLWGFVLLIASLAFACLGAALEVGLQQAYLVAQGFGWTWGEDRKPRDNPGFSAVYTVSLFLAAIPIMLGLDPLRLTIFSMALTAASLPMTVVPLLFLLNDAMSARIATVFSPMPRSSS
ncbi:divalent metal cation transporter [Mesorhizobium sp. B2-1-8]|uniref:divalent metal cation transporter n=1 Tax=Mesorhizobium sp. B2-1-8 TaxID=2589967 RepID=UPI0022391FA9|nr:divalent metal cation transporter [Mesorhizobium sp. B2-1-8]